MSISLLPRPDYVVGQTVQSLAIFPKLYNVPWNSISFQIQWDSSLTRGTFTVYGSNENCAPFQLAASSANVPALTPIPLASIDIATEPYASLLAGMIEVTSACAVVWLHYGATGEEPPTGTVSVAVNGKSLG